MTTATTKKLFLSTVTVPVYVYAESADKAKEASYSTAALLSGVPHATATAQEIVDISEVPADMIHDRPHGSEKRTIGEIMYFQIKK